MKNNTNIDSFLSSEPYNLKQKEKEKEILPILNELTQSHNVACLEYNSVLKALNYDFTKNLSSIDKIPFLPVRLFKEYKLSSINDADVIKILTSSGTTSQSVSKIYLDRDTAHYQTKALVSIMKSYLGNKRLPMLIIDHPNVIKDRTTFSARGAGILGLMNFGRDITYILNNEMEINFDILNEFLAKYPNEPIFIFGFTFMIWEYLYKPMKEKNISFNIPKGILVHSGGWKKLQIEAIDNISFKKNLTKLTGVKSIYNFYGMIEQAGGIYLECDAGYLHTPIFSEIIIRNPNNWSVLPIGVEGIIQVISILPHSYPGHSLLTEDTGRIVGIDDCTCGKKGKYFLVAGRIPFAEARGCSDTYVNEVP